MPGAAIGAGILGGAIGGGLAVTVLAPLTAANNFLGSYFFGSGMILGERQMYQDDWIKIKKRLDAGESFLVILEEVMKPNTQAVMQMARETVVAISKEWNEIVLDYIQTIPAAVYKAINDLMLGNALDEPWPLGEGVIAIKNGVVQCHSDYHRVGDTCVLNEDVVTPPPPPPHIHEPGKHGHKTLQQIEDEKKDVDKEIDKQHSGTKMAEYTKFLNKIVFLNKTIKALEARQNPPAHVLNSIKNFKQQKVDILKFFATWRKNNRAWLVNNNLPL